MRHQSGWRRWGPAAVCAMGLALVPSGAMGQPADGTATARAAFERGIAAVEREQFADAAAAFEESYRLRAVPVVLFNLAGAYDRMGRVRQAMDTYQRYLREAGGSTSPERLAFVATALERLRGRLATVDVVLTPAGAALTVDGRDETVNPEGLRLDPGDRVFAVSAEGFVTHRETLVLRPGERSTLRLSLAPQVAAQPTPVVQPPRAVTEALVSDARVRPDAPEGASGTDRGGVTRRWWFWTGVGVVTVGATAAVLGALGAFNTQPPPPPGLDYGVNALMAR